VVDDNSVLVPIASAIHLKHRNFLIGAHTSIFLNGTTGREFSTTAKISVRTSLHFASNVASDAAFLTANAQQFGVRHLLQEKYDNVQ